MKEQFIYSIHNFLDIGNENINIALIGVVHNLNRPIIQGILTTSTNNSINMTVQSVEFQNASIRITNKKDISSFIAKIINSTFSNSSIINVRNAKQVTIKHCYFKNSELPSNLIAVEEVDNVIIHENIYENNVARKDNTVLISIIKSIGNISSIKFTNNSAIDSALSISCIYIVNSTITLQSLLFTENTFNKFVSTHQSNLTIMNLDFKNNFAENGYIVGYENSSGRISSIMLEGNIGLSTAFHFTASNITLHDITLHSNDLYEGYYAKSCSFVIIKQMNTKDDSFHRSIMYMDDIQHNEINNVKIRNVTTFMGFGFLATPAIINNLHMERCNITSLIYSLQGTISLAQITAND